MFKPIVHVLLCLCVIYGNDCTGSEETDKQGLLAQFESRKQWFIEEGILHRGEAPNNINRLIQEDSPYLLRHALQPIDWLPWTDDILALAQKQKKLIYVSIGYDTCHWCHVLANESYINTDIAKVLNHHFINVKIDREILPEVDAKYRLALEKMTGNPGWPIQVILTPDGDILWIDSYLPQSSLLNLLNVISTKWLATPDKLSRKAKSLNDRLLSSQQLSVDMASLFNYHGRLVQDVKAILSQELTHDAPRFLRAEWLLQLLNEFEKTTNPEYVDIVKSQVDRFLMSATYDFIDGGMHRYSETGDWQTPHFEKMLYDQAQLIRVLVKLYSITGIKQYIDFAAQTVSFVDSKMSHDRYYVSSLSALSNDIEGGYYKIAITDVLPLSTEQQMLINYLPDNQLFYLRSIDLPSPQLIDVFSQLRQKRFDFPMADKKGILSWNALYAVALAEMYSATLDKQIEQKWYQHIDQISELFYRNEQLYRIVYNGRTSVKAKLDDYALLIQALLLKYGVSGNTDDLTFAIKLSHQMNQELKHADLLALAMDDQLPSMVAMVINAYRQLYLATGDSAMAERMSQLTSKTVLSPVTVSQLSILSSIDKTGRSDQSPCFFGRGKGVVNFVLVDNKLILKINLIDGWHINSNKPLDKKLIPTRLRTIDGELVNADFPSAKMVSLSFSKEMLGVYDSDIRIAIDIRQLDDSNLPLKLTMQMCSDTLCLLPETLLLRPPRVF
jgi:uncharacterized protein YyaL (SSP411 family)